MKSAPISVQQLMVVVTASTACSRVALPGPAASRQAVPTSTSVAIDGQP